MLRVHLEDGCPLVRVAAVHAVPERTLRRWLAAYRAGGLAALARRPRSDRGRRRMPPELQLLIEGLALRRPPPTIATVHRQAAEVAREQGWPVPGYAAVYDVVRSIDPAMATLAHEGAKRYREVFHLVHRREAARPNEIWQADHTLLDLWVVTPSGRPARPWLTMIEDDHSRAVAGYAVNLGAPSALTTALAFRQAIWRKPWPDWHVCGIPAAFHVDHGSDFEPPADLEDRTVAAMAAALTGSRARADRRSDPEDRAATRVHLIPEVQPPAGDETRVQPRPQLQPPAEDETRPAVTPMVIRLPVWRRYRGRLTAVVAAAAVIIAAAIVIPLSLGGGAPAQATAVIPLHATRRPRYSA